MAQKVNHIQGFHETRSETAGHVKWAGSMCDKPIVSCVNAATLPLCSINLCAYVVAVHAFLHTESANVQVNCYRPPDLM